MKRCVITGAAAGIGRALVEVYACFGCEVVGFDVDVEECVKIVCELL